MVIKNIEIEKPAYGGTAIGRHAGKVLFVHNALPGETVDICITREKKDYSFADAVNIVKSSPERIEPQCPVYGKCGGCSFLHCKYEAELLQKKQVVADTLARTAQLDRDDIPEITVVADKRFGYRSHASVKFSNHVPGFFQRDSHTHIALPEKGCLLLHETLNQEIQHMHESSGERKVALDGEGAFIAGMKQTVHETVENITFQRGLLTFFQANRFLRPVMLKTVKEYADLAADDTFVDIGCGVGFFALYLARFARLGVGCDINKESVRRAKRNAKYNKIQNVSFKAVPDHALHPVHDRGDIVFADPPRAGLSKRTRKTIIAMQPRKIVYVSCNPATYARDLNTFNDAGFRLNRICLIDMFPGTYHIELITELAREG